VISLVLETARVAGTGDRARPRPLAFGLSLAVLKQVLALS
jgi:hypothetical protein